MGYNQIIFNSLAARKAIFIEGIGVVSVVRKGSLKSNPKASSEFPHYELVLSNTECQLSLKEAHEGDYEAWLRSITKVDRKERIFNVGGSFSLRLRGDGTSQFETYSELEMLLNPFSNGKKRRGHSVMVILSSILVTAACCGCLLFFLIDSGYISLPENSVNLLSERAHKPTVEPAIQPANELLDNNNTTPEDESLTALDSSFINRPLVKTDTISESKSVIKTDTIVEKNPEIKSKPIEKKVDKVTSTIAEPTASDTYTKPINGRFYLVISSFRTQAMARKDIPRLEKILENKIKVLTTKKIDGNYINYIFVGKTEDEVVSYQMTLNGKYEQLSGMWVYEMKK